jgi:dephospho-CoA kinase
MKIIGLSGTNGSGKDTIGHALAEQKNYLFISVTDLLREEAKQRGLEPSREMLRTISAEWRRESGLGVLILKAIEVFNNSGAEYAGLAVASLRNPGEADEVHANGGIVVWADAKPDVRYNRVQQGNRGRGAEDNKTYEEFLTEEQAEMTASGDTATLDMSAVKAKADVFLDNSSDDIENFKVSVLEELKEYI